MLVVLNWKSYTYFVNTENAFNKIKKYITKRQSWDTHIILFVCEHLYAQYSLVVCDPVDCSPPGFFCPWEYPAKNTEVGCCFLPQGTFPTQG